MDHVLVKVKGLRRKPYRIMLSDHTLYEPINIDLNACVPYDPDHNLDEESWFKIEQFSQQPFCLDLLKVDFNAAEYDDLVKDQFAKIGFVLSIQDGNYYFQKITKSLFVTKKMIAFGEVAEVETTQDRIVVNQCPDAVYFENEDTLIFTNLSSITSIFSGIDSLFKKATEQQVEDFLKQPFIQLEDGYEEKKVSTPNRKRISMALERFEQLDAQQKDQMFDYIHDYCENINFDKNAKTFNISNDDELKYLLYGIDQRFYTTPLSHEKRLANSVQSI